MTVDYEEIVNSISQKCPAFHHGCPYSKANGRKIEDVIGACPAFKNGCPFSGKSEKEVEIILQEIPKNHKICPAFVPTNEHLVCLDGFGCFAISRYRECMQGHKSSSIPVR